MQLARDWQTKATRVLKAAVDATEGQDLELEFGRPRPFRTWILPGKRCVDRLACIDDGPLGDVEPLYMHGLAPGQCDEHDALINPDAGRVKLETTHPWEGNSHPLPNTALLCNVDASCFDRAIDVKSIRALPKDEQDAALESATMISAHKCFSAARYVHDYATKHAKAVHDPLQSVGTSLADLDARTKTKEAEEGRKIGHRVAARQRLNRAVSGYNKAFAKPLSAAMFPWMGSDFVGRPNPDAPVRETRIASHRFWEIQIPLPLYIGHQVRDAMIDPRAASPEAPETGLTAELPIPLPTLARGESIRQICNGSRKQKSCSAAASRQDALHDSRATTK